jgi:hypothetical protein
LTKVKAANIFTEVFFRYYSLVLQSKSLKQIELNEQIH